MMPKHLSLALILALPCFIPQAAATHDPNDFFATEATFPGVTWFSVHGASATAVWAVGSSSGSPRIAFYDGASWTLQTPPASPSLPLSSVYAASATEAWATYGSAGSPTPATNMIARFSGGSWSAVTITPLGGSATASWADVAGIGTNFVLAVGSLQGTSTTFGTLGDWDGVAFEKCSTCTSNQPFHAVWPVATNDFWIAGYTSFSTVGYYRESSPNTCCSSAPDQLLSFAKRDMWGSSASDIWAVGNEGSIDHFNGITWAPFTSPVGETLSGVWGNSASDVWAVGQGADSIIHFDGSAWTTEPVTTAETLLDVWCANATNCWTVGTGGVIQRLQVNPSVALPSLAGLVLSPHDFEATASQAQCLGDPVSLQSESDVTIGAAGVDAYVINVESNMVVEFFDNIHTAPAPWFDLNDKLQYASRAYPSGEYVLLGTLDNVGVVEPDLYSSYPFNVPEGSCLDATQDDSLSELTGQHFDQDLFHGGSGTGGGLLSQFPGMDVPDSSAILLFLIIMGFGLWNGKQFIAGAALLGLGMSWLPSLDAGSDYDQGIGFFTGLALVIIAFWLETIVAGWRLRRETTTGGVDP